MMENLVDMKAAFSLERKPSPGEAKAQYMRSQMNSPETPGSPAVGTPSLSPPGSATPRFDRSEVQALFQDSPAEPELPTPAKKDGEKAGPRSARGRTPLKKPAGAPASRKRPAAASASGAKKMRAETSELDNGQEEAEEEEVAANDNVQEEEAPEDAEEEVAAVEEVEKEEEEPPQEADVELGEKEEEPKQGDVAPEAPKDVAPAAPKHVAPKVRKSFAGRQKGPKHDELKQLFYDVFPAEDCITWKEILFWDHMDAHYGQDPPADLKTLAEQFRTAKENYGW